jgi:hypothetical protein
MRSDAASIFCQGSINGNFVFYTRPDHFRQKGTGNVQHPEQADRKVQTPYLPCQEKLGLIGAIKRAEPLARPCLFGFSG